LSNWFWRWQKAKLQFLKLNKTMKKGNWALVAWIIFLTCIFTSCGRLETKNDLINHLALEIRNKAHFPNSYKLISVTSVSSMEGDSRHWLECEYQLKSLSEELKILNGTFEFDSSYNLIDMRCKKGSVVFSCKEEWHSTFSSQSP
jgi:hypothetical protein